MNVLLTRAIRFDSTTRLLAVSLVILGGCVVQGGGNSGGGVVNTATDSSSTSQTTSTTGSGLLGSSAGAWEIYAGCKLTLTGSTGSANCPIEPVIVYVGMGSPLAIAGNRTFAITLAESKVGISVTTNVQGSATIDGCKITVDGKQTWQGDANKASGKQESGLFTAFAGKWNGLLAIAMTVNEKNDCTGKTITENTSGDVNFSLDLGGTSGTLTWHRTSAGKVVDDGNVWAIAGAGGKVTMTSSTNGKIKSFSKQ